MSPLMRIMKPPLGAAFLISGPGFGLCALAVIIAERVDQRAADAAAAAIVDRLRIPA